MVWDGTEKPVAYTSRSLSKVECNYSQLEKEGLACVNGVKRFHAYLFALTTNPSLLFSVNAKHHLHKLQLRSVGGCCFCLRMSIPLTYSVPWKSRRIERIATAANGRTTGTCAALGAFGQLTCNSTSDSVLD